MGWEASSLTEVAAGEQLPELQTPDIWKCSLTVLLASCSAGSSHQSAASTTGKITLAIVPSLLEKQFSLAKDSPKGYTPIMLSNLLASVYSETVKTSLNLRPYFRH